MIGDSGSYASVGMKVLERAAGHASGPYRIPAIDVEAIAVRTNNPACGAFRGFGANQAQFAMEGVIDRLAEQVGISGWEMRTRNVVHPGDVWGPGQIMDDGCQGADDLPRRASGPPTTRHGRPARRSASGSGSRTPGSATGSSRSPRRSCGSGRTARSRCATAGPRWARASTRSPCRWPSTELGVDPDAHRGARRHDTRARRRPDHRQPRHADGRRLGGRGLPRRAGRRLPGRASTTRASTASTGPTRSPTASSTRSSTPRSATPRSWWSSTAETGAIEKVVAVHDVGRAVNPLLCEGQIEGAVHMGLGYALTEDFPADDQGRPTAHDPQEPRHPAPQGHARRSRSSWSSSPSPARPTASRASARSGSCRPRARSPPRCTRSTARGGPRCPWPRPRPRRPRARPRGPSRDRMSSPVSDLTSGPTALTPGLVCAHHHLYSALARGLPGPATPPSTFLEILEPIWWRLDVALDLDAIAASARLGALEALEGGCTAVIDHHESPERHRRQPRRHRRGLRRGRRPGVVRLRGHRPPRSRRRQGRSGRERAVHPSARPRRRPPTRPGRRARRVHLRRRDARRGGGAGRRPRRGRARPRGRGARRRRRRRSTRGPHRRPLAARARRPPGRRPRPARHDRAQPTVEHEQRRRLRPPVALLEPGGARHRRHRRDMLDEFRVAFARLREDDIGASADRAWAWLATGWDLFPEALGDRVRWSYEPMEPWALAYTTDVRPLEVTVDGEVVLTRRTTHPRRRRRDPGQGHRAGRRAVRDEMVRNR